MVVSMLGTDTSSGDVIDGVAHLRQCIVDVLRTPLGSRAMRPEYGSRLFFLMDRAWNDELRAEVVAAVVEALINCVPEVTPKVVVPRSGGKGVVVFDLEVMVCASGEGVVFEGMEVAV